MQSYQQVQRDEKNLQREQQDIAHDDLFLFSVPNKEVTIAKNSLACYATGGMKEGSGPHGAASWREKGAATPPSRIVTMNDDVSID
jgi:hypothetical protein